MSLREVERFVADANKNKSLQEQLKSKAEAGVAGLIEVAKASGYEVSDADVQEYISAHQAELSEQQLAATAGGAAVYNPYTQVVGPTIIIIHVLTAS